MLPDKAESGKKRYVVGRRCVVIVYRPQIPLQYVGRKIQHFCFQCMIGARIVVCAQFQQHTMRRQVFGNIFLRRYFQRKIERYAEITDETVLFFRFFVFLLFLRVFIRFAFIVVVVENAGKNQHAGKDYQFL